MQKQHLFGAVSNLFSAYKIVHADVKEVREFPKTFNRRFFLAVEPVADGALVYTDSVCEFALIQTFGFEQLVYALNYQYFHIDIICLWAYNILNTCPWAIQQEECMGNDTFVGRYRIINRALLKVCHVALVVVLVGLFVLPLFSYNYTVNDCALVYSELADSDDKVLFSVSMFLTMFSIVCSYFGMLSFGSYMNRNLNAKKWSTAFFVIACIGFAVFPIGVFLLKMGVKEIIDAIEGDGVRIKGDTGYVLVIVFGAIMQLFSLDASYTMFSIINTKTPEVLFGFEKQAYEWLNEKTDIQPLSKNDITSETQKTKSNDSMQTKREYVIKKVGERKYIGRVYEKEDYTGKKTKMMSCYDAPQYALKFHTQKEAETFATQNDMNPSSFEVIRFK